MSVRLAIFGAVSCHLAHAQPSPSPPACNQVDGDYPGCGISKSTYSATDPVAGKTWIAKYFPVQVAGDECDNDICDCSGWEIQQGRVFTTREVSPGAGGQGSPGNGFGMHFVNVSAHLTTGGYSVAQVENHFNSKLGDMTTFDSFMDFNVVFSTSDLQGYKTTFKADGVKYLAGTWNDEDGKEYSSIIVHVPRTQLVLELVQPGSLKFTEDEATPLKLEQRVPSVAIQAQQGRLSSRQNVSSSSKVGSNIVSLVVNRAVSATAMSKLEDFYVTGMGTQKTHDSTENDVTKKCFLWTGATVHICFTSRPDSATKGHWKVGDFEDMLNAVHSKIIDGYPLCPMDKWTDNHYAVDSQTADTSSIIAYVNKNKPFHTCASSPMSQTASLAYLVDPTGWSVQLDVKMSSAPSDCSSSVFDSIERVTGHNNPACTVETSNCPSSMFSSKSTVIV